MDDRHMVQVETTEGARTAASGNERVLIGLAMLALLGAVLIIVSNLVGVDLEASASGSSEPSIKATRTPRPTRSPAPRLQMILDPPELSAPSSEPSSESYYQSYWIRAEEDLPVRDSPSLGHAAAYTIRAGSAALVYETGRFADGLEWVTLEAPHGGMWVATRVDGHEVVTRYRQEEAVQPGWVSGLTAGPGGFVLTGRQAGPWDQPLDMVLASADGVAWSGTGVRAFGSAQGWQASTAVWGPAGWLALAFASSDSQATWIHGSGNGVTWEPLGSVPAGFDSGRADSMVASQFGYVLTFDSGRFNSERFARRFFFSADGVAWREMGNLPAPRGDPAPAYTFVVGVPDGFLAMTYLDGRNGPPSLVGSAFSIDGRDWTEVVVGPTGLTGFGANIVAVGDRVIGVDTDPADGATRIWVGSIRRGILTWRRVPGADAAFDGGAVTALTSDGTRAFALGVDRTTSRSVAWTGDGINWTRETLPAEFPGVPTSAAAGPSGVVVVGSVPTMRGSNPVLWHRTPGGDWQPERSPVFEVAPDRPPDCGLPPADLFDLSARDRISVVTCFGSAPITFRAWWAACDWCGADQDPNFTPAWLGYGSSNQLNLTLLEEAADYWAIQAFLPPSLPAQPEWVGSWVEVTGHFDDPIALTCRYDRGDVPWYYSDPTYRDSWINGCRQQFIIDAIAVVDGL